MKTIDLHVHSNISDGTCTPEELVQLARSTGLSAFALTDHDTVLGIERAIRASSGTGVEVIPGIEFSTLWQHRDVHILGYWIDYQNQTFRERLQEFMDARDSRNEKMCLRIREYTGFPCYLSELQSRYPDAVITRAHMAAWMVEQGYVKTRSIAFDKYLGDHAPCFIPKTQVSPQDAIGLILEYGGVPVLAHPLLYALSGKQMTALLDELTPAGLRGIETYYSMNRGSDAGHVLALAQKYGLLPTGGSDFHGENKPDIALGTGRGHNLAIPYHILEDLKEARR